MELLGCSDRKERVRGEGEGREEGREGREVEGNERGRGEERRG